MLVWQLPSPAPVILSYNRGCQFTSEEYKRLLAVHHMQLDWDVSAKKVIIQPDPAHTEVHFGGHS